MIMMLAVGLAIARPALAIGVTGSGAAVVAWYPSEAQYIAQDWQGIFNSDTIQNRYVRTSLGIVPVNSGTTWTTFVTVYIKNNGGTLSCLANWRNVLTGTSYYSTSGISTANGYAQFQISTTVTLPPGGSTWAGMLECSVPPMNASIPSFITAFFAN
jgi:hypothetical protein